MTVPMMLICKACNRAAAEISAEHVGHRRPETGMAPKQAHRQPIQAAWGNRRIYPNMAS